MSLSPELRVDLGWLFIVLALALVLLLWHQHEVHNTVRLLRGQPTKSPLAHVRTHAPHHASALVMAGIGLALLLGAGAATYVLYHGGARFNVHLHIHPQLPPAGAALVPIDLSMLLPNPLPSQGASNACWSFTGMALLYGEEHARGAARMPVPSPWRTFWYVKGGANATGSLDDAVAGINSAGVEPLAYWPTMGPPDARDALQTVAYSGASDAYIWYGAGYGGGALLAIEAALDAHHPVALLLAVNQNMLANSQAVVDDGGAFVFYHYVEIFGWDYDAQSQPIFHAANWWGPAWGLNGEAWLSGATILTDGLSAGIIHPGPAIAAWLPPPPPRPTATTRPRPPTNTPTPHTKGPPPPTKTPLPPSSTPVPVAAIIHRSTNLRDKPAGHILQGLPAGTHVLDLRRSTPHWRLIRARFTGWVLIATLH